MKILRLVLTSFGNQKDKVIDFTENVNLVMGADEEALRTVRAFINGMLFGQTAEEKKRYRPKCMPYCGSMFLSEGEEEIRLDRNFMNGQFVITDASGSDLTETYTDENGNLLLLEERDSIYSENGLEIPQTPEEQSKTLAHLKEKRRSLENSHDYEGMLESRRKLLVRLDAQKKLEEQIRGNEKTIADNEARIHDVVGRQDAANAAVDQQIATLTEQSARIDKKIAQLHDLESRTGIGRTQILKRNVQGTRERLGLIDKRLAALRTQEAVYRQKLDTLEAAFPVERDALKADYDKFCYARKAEQAPEREPFFKALLKVKPAIYAVLMVLGAAAVALALINPNDTMTRVPVFLLSFAGVFLLLSGAYMLWIKSRVGAPAESEAEETAAPLSAVEAVVQKYHQKSPEDFVDFYQKAKKLYAQMDSVRADLSDIEKEIKDSGEEKAQVREEQRNYETELRELPEPKADSETIKRLTELKKEKNQLYEQIQALKASRSEGGEDSVWKLKEASVKLAEENEKLRAKLDASEDVITSFDKLQERIDAYETSMTEYDTKINAIESTIRSETENALLTYADPNRSDYKEKMLTQFGFGLQGNLLKGADVPLITMDPFEAAHSTNPKLIEKFKTFIAGRQVLVFSSGLEEKQIFSGARIPYNGIFVL